MKICKLALVVLLSGACAVGAHAQKQLKYVSQAVKGTKTIPYVVNPKLPPTVRANFAMPVVRANVNTAVERKVVQVAAQAQKAAQLPQPKDFLTGVQALQTLRPGWRSELMLAGFNGTQLTAVEEAFAETDEILFELDENGNWVKPLGDDWEYSAWFTQVLTDKVALNDGQIKTLFGKFSRLDDVFTRLNEQSFIAVHKRAPKTNAPGEEGKLARKATYNLDKRDGRKMNPEVEGYVYGKTPAKLKTPTPSYGPRGRAPRRTPEEVLEQVQQFIKENDGRFPSQHSENPEEKSLRFAFDWVCKKADAQNLQDDTSRRLLVLKEKYVSKIAAFRTPQEILGQVEMFMKENGGRFPSQHSENPEEKSLRKAFDKACKKIEEQQLEDDTSRTLLTLKKKYVSKYTPGRTSQEVLEQIEMFMKENDGHFPSQQAKIPEEKSLRKAFDKACKKIEEQQLEDDTSRTLLTLKKKYVSKYTAERTSQEVLEQIEMFMKENDGHFPSQLAKSLEERTLRFAFDWACRNATVKNLTDETSLKLLALKKQCVRMWNKKSTE